MTENNRIKVFLKKLYRVFIEPIVKVFNWLFSHLRDFQSASSSTPMGEKGLNQTVIQSKKEEPEINTGVLEAEKKRVQAQTEQEQLEASKQRIAEDKRIRAEKRAAVCTAIEKGDVSMVKEYFKEISLNVNQHTRLLYLHDHYFSIVKWALWNTRNQEIIQVLLDHYQSYLDYLRKAGVNPHTPELPEEDLFRIAVEEANNIEAVKILIHSPHVKLLLSYTYPNDYPRKSISSTPLYRAMENKNPEMAEFLIDAGVTLGQRLYTDEQLGVIANYKKHITPLYEKALECLDSVIPEKGIKSIIFDYVAPYMEPSPPENESSVEGRVILKP